MTRARAFHGPALAAIALYLGLVAILLGQSQLGTEGTFVYVQDDPYIHLALARTLAEHGVWGVAPGEFASASSSPLWTLLLAGFWKLGADAVWVPFALNLIFGAVLVAVCSSYLSDALRPTALVLTLCGVVLVTPLPTLAFIGMEHTLQVLLVVVFSWQASTRLADRSYDWAAPCPVAAVLVATRYESLFLVASVCALLLWQKRLKPALALGIASAAPVAAFAAYSVAHGGLVLPNSVLMKSDPGRFASVATGIAGVAADWIGVVGIFRHPAQLVLTVGALAALLLVPYSRLAKAERPVWLATMFVSTSAVHACLVQLHWFYRYEAYLVALGMLACASLAPLLEWPRGKPRTKSAAWHPAMTPLVVLLGLPLGVRAIDALSRTGPAARNVFEQQVQLGRFFAAFYPGRPIAVNDLGAVAYLSSCRILDLVGLASEPVADLRRHSAFDRDALRRLADQRQIEVIALYEGYFANVLPAEWVKVGEWTIPDNVAVTGDTVAFFGRTAADAERLRAHLDAFAPRLPHGVRWSANTTRVRPPSS